MSNQELRRAVDIETRRVQSLRGKLDARLYNVTCASQVPKTLQPLAAQEEAHAQRSKAELAQLTAEVEALRHEIDRAEKVQRDREDADAAIDALCLEVKDLSGFDVKDSSDGDNLSRAARVRKSKTMREAEVRLDGVARGRSELRKSKTKPREQPDPIIRDDSQEVATQKIPIKSAQTGLAQALGIASQVTESETPETPQGESTTGHQSVKSKASTRTFALPTPEVVVCRLSAYKGPPATCQELHELRRALDPSANLQWRLRFKALHRSET